MRIVCVDKSAAARLKLRQVLEIAYESGRSTVGHLPLAQIELMSKEELSVNKAPDVVVIGPEFVPDEAYSLCLEIKNEQKDTPILLVLQSEHYSLRTLRRFERVTTDVFVLGESDTRLLHMLCRLEQQQLKAAEGKLIAVCGVKGGVGATSIVGGLAHAAQAMGKSAVILDLSTNAALLHYMGTPRWQSSEFATCLLEGIAPDRNLIESCIAVSPNGLNLFLPPAGSTEVRELWLRDPNRLNYTLGIVEMLREQFDVIFVDVANTEGVLPFAMLARADTRLLVTSNDPASIHLLSRKIGELSQVPGDGELRILVSMLTERGLTKDDVVDFLLINRNFNQEMSQLRPIPFDAQGKNWIGTGNTFYTESKKPTQTALEHCLAHLLESGELREESREPRTRFSITQIMQRLPLDSYRKYVSQKALPFFPRVDTAEEKVIAPEQPALQPKLAPLETPPPVEIPEVAVAKPEKVTTLYEPPRLVVND